MDAQQKSSLQGSLMLLLGAVIWGAAFVAQRMGTDDVGPFTFTGVRMLLGAAVMVPVIGLMDRRQKRPAPAPAERRRQWKAGLICGGFLFAASSLQQMGLITTSAGKSGFITALYVVLVPIVGWLLFHQHPGRAIWISIALAVVALYLLCVGGGRFELQIGDLLTMGCAVCFTGQILAVGYYAPRVNPARLSCIQFLVSGVLGMAVAICTEEISLEGLRSALIPILYTGIFSSAVGYTLQAMGQKRTNAAVASLIMCLESVFATLAGALVLGERMSLQETLGCVLMFLAVVLVQLSPLLTSRRHPGSRSAP